MGERHRGEEYPMSSDAKIAALTLATGLMLAAAHGAPAQTVATDPRWYPWLGCWHARGVRPP